MRGKGRGSRGHEDSDTDTEDILAGIKVWDDLDTGLPEVLPTELVGWLMLRRCALSSQQRLNILSSVGNSLKAEDIERGLRGAEEELRLHDREQHPKGGGKKGRPVFWMEHMEANGHCSMPVRRTWMIGLLMSTGLVALRSWLRTMAF